MFNLLLKYLLSFFQQDVEKMLVENSFALLLVLNKQMFQIQLNYIKKSYLCYL